MFLYNAFWKWNSSDPVDPDGVVIHAAGCPRENAERRPSPASRSGFVLFDPDAYLWALDPTDCHRAVDNIETYPWVPPLDVRSNPSSMSDEAVLRTLRESAAWQEARGASRVILPTPLVSDPSGPIDEFVRWMDLGLRIAPELGRPALIALGLSDVAVASQLDTVLDQVTARDIHGVYAFVETSRSSGSVAVSQEVARALLMISHFVGQRMAREVVVNFADVFGLACLAVGARAYVGGYERKARRLDFQHFEEQDGGGGAFPKFFSLATTARYRPERDMDRIRDERLLRLLRSDQTGSSESLFRALDAGRSASEVPEWRESRGNVGMARSHLIERLCSASDEIAAFDSVQEKAGWALDWLQNAERDVAYLNARFESAPLDDDGRHVRVWREAFEGFVERFGII